MNWLWKKLGLAEFVKELVKDIVFNSLVHELQQGKFYLIVLPEDLIEPSQVTRVHRFLEERGIECLIAAANSVQLVELGD